MGSWAPGGCSYAIARWEQEQELRWIWRFCSARMLGFTGFRLARMVGLQRADDDDGRGRQRECMVAWGCKDL